MKKCLILILSIVFVFCFAACADNKTKTNQDFTDVKYYADLGQINGVDCKLGESAESAKQKLDAAEQASADAEEQAQSDSSIRIESMNTNVFFIMHLREISYLCF